MERKRRKYEARYGDYWAEQERREVARQERERSRSTGHGSRSRSDGGGRRRRGAGYGDGAYEPFDDVEARGSGVSYESVSEGSD